MGGLAGACQVRGALHAAGQLREARQLSAGAPHLGSCHISRPRESVNQDRRTDAGPWPGAVSGLGRLAVRLEAARLLHGVTAWRALTTSGRGLVCRGCPLSAALDPASVRANYRVTVVVTQGLSDHPGHPSTALSRTPGVGSGVLSRPLRRLATWDALMPVQASRSGPLRVRMQVGGVRRWAEVRLAMSSTTADLETLRARRWRSAV